MIDNFSQRAVPLLTLSVRSKSSESNSNSVNMGFLFLFFQGTAEMKAISCWAGLLNQAPNLVMSFCPCFPHPLLYFPRVARIVRTSDGELQKAAIELGLKLGVEAQVLHHPFTHSPLTALIFIIPSRPHRAPTTTVSTVPCIHWACCSVREFSLAEPSARTTCSSTLLPFKNLCKYQHLKYQHLKETHFEHLIKTEIYFSPVFTMLPTLNPDLSVCSYYLLLTIAYYLFCLLCAYCGG